MRAAGIALVVLACAALAVPSLREGLDPAGLGILACTIGFGWLAIAVLRRTGSGKVRPLTCESCGGLNSPNAPYCKHCGAQAS